MTQPSLLQNIQWDKPEAQTDAPDMSNFDGKALNDLRSRIINEDPNVTLQEMRQAVQFVFNLRGKVAADADARREAEKAAKATQKKPTAKKALAAKGDDLLKNLFSELGE